MEMRKVVMREPKPQINEMLFDSCTFVCHAVYRVAH